MAKKINVLKIEGANLKSFAASFADKIDTGLEDSGGIGSDWTGSIDASGNFAFSRRKSGKSMKSDYQAALTGKVLPPDENGLLEIQYVVRRSPVFAVSFFVIAAAAAGFLAWAIYSAAVLEKARLLLPASFFFGAALLLMIDFIVSPDCRALEKQIMKIAADSCPEGGEEETK